MNKQRFDLMFDAVFPDAVKHSFTTVQPPSPEAIRMSWRELHRKRERWSGDHGFAHHASEHDQLAEESL